MRCRIGRRSSFFYHSSKPASGLSKSARPPASIPPPSSPRPAAGAATTRTPSAPAGPLPAPSSPLPAPKLPPGVRKRDQLVRRIARQAKSLSARLSTWREQSLRDIFTLSEETWKKYGWQIQHGVRGSIDLHTHDGSLKIEVRKDDKIAFNEQLAGVQAEILRLVNGWAAGGNKNLIAVIDAAFKPGRGGKLSAQRILGLQRTKITDPEWEVCMQALRDAMRALHDVSPEAMVEAFGEEAAKAPTRWATSVAGGALTRVGGDAGRVMDIAQASLDVQRNHLLEEIRDNTAPGAVFP
jgi:hypothetical protein